MIYYIRCTACCRLYGYDKPVDTCKGFHCQNEVRSHVVNTTESATQIGPQRGPSSSAKINAETKQAQRELDLAGEQRDDDQVVAGRKCCFCEEFQKDGEMDDHLLKVHHYAS